MKVTNFSGTVCWITGASSGIGAALAIELNRLGASLILSARQVANLEKVKAAFTNPAPAVIIPCDMENMASLPAISSQAWMQFSGVDYVFLNAGFAVRDWLIETEFQLVEKVMRVNFFSAVVIAKTLLPLMIKKGGGTFVVTSSLSGKHGIPKLSAYSASKHALHGFFETLRAEHARDGIHVTIVVPGLVRTNISIHSLTGSGTVSGKMQEAIATGMSPEKCARGMLRAVARGKTEALIGGVETFSVLLKRFFPGWFDYIIRNHPLKKIRALTIWKK